MSKTYHKFDRNDRGEPLNVDGYPPCGALVKSREGIPPTTQQGGELSFRRSEKEIQQAKRDLNLCEGYTLVEILAILILIGILVAIVSPQVLLVNKSLPSATTQLISTFKFARAKAITTTSYYRIKPDPGAAIPANQLLVEYNTTSCTATTGWTTDYSFSTSDLTFPIKVQMVQPTTINGIAQATATSWSLCYKPRGLADNDVQLTLQDLKSNKTQTVEVFLGGGVTP